MGRISSPRTTFLYLKYRVLNVIESFCVFHTYNALCVNCGATEGHVYYAEFVIWRVYYVAFFSSCKKVWIVSLKIKVRSNWNKNQSYTCRCEKTVTLGIANCTLRNLECVATDNTQGEPVFGSFSDPSSNTLPCAPSHYSIDTLATVNHQPSQVKPGLTSENTHPHANSRRTRTQILEN